MQICIDFENVFTIIFQTFIGEQLCRWKFLFGTTWQQSSVICMWKINFFAFVSRFRALNEGEGVKLGAHFVVVVGKPTPDFLIPVYLSYLEQISHKSPK